MHLSLKYNNNNYTDFFKLPNKCYDNTYMGFFELLL